MWNWTYEASHEGEATTADIWRIWIDIAGWPSWDSELEWSCIEGEFTAGVIGTLKAKGWAPLDFTITEVDEGVGFKDVTTLPLGTILEFHHFIEALSTTRCRVTHRVSASGPLAFILRFTLRRKLKANLPGALKALLLKAGATND